MLLSLQTAQISQPHLWAHAKGCTLADDGSDRLQGTHARRNVHAPDRLQKESHPGKQ